MKKQETKKVAAHRRVKDVVSAIEAIENNLSAAEQLLKSIMRRYQDRIEEQHREEERVLGEERMRYSVSNSEAVERAIGRLCHYEQSLGSVVSDGRTVKAALDELQEKVDEQQVENNRLRRRCWSWIDEARMWRQSEHACDEQYTRLYADYKQQAAYIEQLEEQLERSFSQMMRQLDEAEAEAKGT